MRIVYFIILFSFVCNCAKNQGLSNSLNEIADMNNVLGAKNLLPNIAETKTVGGVTRTANADGSITLNGTSTGWGQSDVLKGLLPKGTYKISIGTPLPSKVWATLRNDDTSTSILNIGNGSSTVEGSFTLSSDTNVRLFCGIEEGATLNNLTFYPMIRPASIQDDTYVPYSMTNREMTPYVQAISNPNLLDNPWFTVNQRGQNSYSENGKYFVDRFRSLGAPTIAVNNGITITANADANGFRQLFESVFVNSLLGKTVTLSVMLSDGTIKSRTQELPSSKPSSLTEYATILVQTGVTIALFIGGNGNQFLQFYIANSGTSVSIKAVKLELGSVSTLSMDSAPNYAEELLKCQRYFVRIKKNGQWGANIIGSLFADGIIFDLNLASTMRANPTMSVISYGTIHTPSNDYVPTAIHVDNLIGNIVRFFASKPGWSFTNHTIANYEGVEFDLSADL